MKRITILVTLLLSSTVFAYDFASPSEPSAKIIMNHSINAKQLFPMRLLMVNGENITVRGSAVWLSPGEYELRFSPTIDTNYTTKTVSVRERNGMRELKNTLKITVEDGKSYYVAYDASSSETKDWEPVVYKVK
ncbi:hypothetical protein ACFODZ_11815 [Marinicella sediminis]|uniref:DUF2846 domain-containing protein n=1 Tax=Marinicella sediminis TaxID=1792834 RepID=A0ABV7JCN1_9GAMM|nr:hypothetical protein [Marinicella sediminis]